MARIPRFHHGGFRVVGRGIALYFFCFVVLVVGIAFGAVSVRLMGVEQKSGLAAYLEELLREAVAGAPSGPAVLQQSAAANLKAAMVLWVAGVSVVGLPVVPAVVFMRGFVLGFTVGFLVEQMGVRGFVYSALAVVPPNLLAVPAISAQGACSLSFGLSILGRRLRGRDTRFSQEVATFSAVTVALTGVLLGSSLLEAYVSPAFLRVLASFASQPPR